MWSIRHSKLIVIVCFCLQGRAEGWLKFAKELTSLIQCIINFAKMVKGFQSLEQDDQIKALKQTVFDLALISMAQVGFHKHFLHL